ncbi:TraB/GumN family protein, partial [Acinetobacter baumannii]
FVVGAGHLGGETGVITLLRKEGYIVKPTAY